NEDLEPAPAEHFLAAPSGQGQQVVVAEGENGVAIERDRDEVDVLQHFGMATLAFAQLPLGAPLVGDVFGDSRDPVEPPRLVADRVASRADLPRASVFAHDRILEFETAGRL